MQPGFGKRAEEAKVVFVGAAARSRGPKCSFLAPAPSRSVRSGGLGLRGEERRCRGYRLMLCPSFLVTAPDLAFLVLTEGLC